MQNVQLASRFYGLNVRQVVPSANNLLTIEYFLRAKATVAAVIAADALRTLDPKRILTALDRKSGTPVPLLIVGINTETEVAILKRWSAGHVLGRDCSKTHFTTGSYLIGSNVAVTRQLATLRFPFRSQETCYFELDATGEVQQIAGILSGKESVPVFVKAERPGSSMFLASEISQPIEFITASDPQSLVRGFVAISSAFMFVHFAAGERAWHSPALYANLTIDDPWLRKTYGYLDYAGLLGEAKKHNFHSTIAFIPWNYARSQPEVVSLFRNHPESLSVCIHGDNHDYKEFTSFGEKPFEDQIAAIRQANARMQQFTFLTGISFDKVMVFPHSIAPERTLSELKKQNFLATVNSTNVPQGSNPPRDPTFALRPVTLSFANFPSLARYSVEAPVPLQFIAVSAFLGNPLLLYCHQAFFASGIDAFDHLADQVNRVDPATRWRSLGEIARHLYLLRLRDPSGYDVQAFSSDFFLENASQTEAVYYVEKEEPKQSAITSVTVDGIPYRYGLASGHLVLVLRIVPGASRHIRIGYVDDPHVAAVDIRKSSLRATFLRWGSDFRDDVLSTHPLGNSIIHIYHDQATQPAKLALFFSVSLFTLILGLLFRALMRRKRPAPGHSNMGNP